MVGTRIEVPGPVNRSLKQLSGIKSANYSPLAALKAVIIITRRCEKIIKSLVILERKKRDCVQSKIR